MKKKSFSCVLSGVACLVLSVAVSGGFSGGIPEAFAGDGMAIPRFSEGYGAMGAPEGVSLVPPSPDEITDPPPAANPPFPDTFALGLGYGRVKEWMGIDDPGGLYRETGAKWVKFPAVPWSLIEPDENGGYTWWLLDSMVKNYQENGFSIIAVLTCEAPWAVADSRSNRVKDARGWYPSSPPLDKYWSRYEAWVKAVVERYDGDGIDDMPGLKRPILDYEIEGRAYNGQHWIVGKSQDPATEYGRLLRVAYQAAHAAHKDVRVVLSSIDLGDLFDDGQVRNNPTLDAIVTVRFADRNLLRESHQKNLAFFRKVLAYSPYFDALEVTYGHDYRSLVPMTQWLRDQMAANNYTRPIWAGDALVANIPYIDSRASSFRIPLGLSLFEALDNRNDPLHGAAWNWYMANQASNLCKKVITAMGAGLVGIMVANEADWPDWRSAGAFWYYAGIYGQSTQDLLSAVSGRRPAFYTFKMLSDITGGGAAKVERVATGENTDLYLYKIVRDGQPDTFVAWHESSDLEKRLRLLSDPVAFLHLDLTAKPATVDLSPFITPPETGKVTVKKIISYMKGVNDPLVPEDLEEELTAVTLGRAPVFLTLAPLSVVQKPDGGEGAAVSAPASASAQ